MQKTLYTKEHIIQEAKLTDNDLEFASKYNHSNRVGVAYQIAYIRLTNRLPQQEPLEIMEEVLSYVCFQINVEINEFKHYTSRKDTISAHQREITNHLRLAKLDAASTPKLKKYIYEMSFQIISKSALMAKAIEHLKNRSIITPAESKLTRIISSERERARSDLTEKISSQLGNTSQQLLDELLISKYNRYTKLHLLKHYPRLPSVAAMLELIDKLDTIKNIGILDIDLEWLNNNYQRMLSTFVKRCSADRIRKLIPAVRYASLVCYLWQLYRDTIDQVIEMQAKLFNKVESQAENEIQEQMRKKRKVIKQVLEDYSVIGEFILDDAINDSALRCEIFKLIDKKRISHQIDSISTFTSGGYSHIFKRIMARFSYFRQFTPSLIEHISFHAENRSAKSIVGAIENLKSMNSGDKLKAVRKLPTQFIPKNLKSLVTYDDHVDKKAWETVLMMRLRDEVKEGNVSIKHSKRFDKFSKFFMPSKEWRSIRKAFFARAGLPISEGKVESFLKDRLATRYDQFFASEEGNEYFEVDESGWHLSVDGADELSADEALRLKGLKRWLDDHLRVIKLPNLLIEVDNDLEFTRQFMPNKLKRSIADEISIIIATVMSHGCNIGQHTMSKITNDISYKQIKHVTDWQLTEDSLKAALAIIVDAISKIGVTESWGKGETSSSDAQRFAMVRKTLRQNFSHKFRDFAIEFYSFVADNYAPFYSTPIECIERDSSYVLDGLLYNESELPLSEHYTDTHGYTEIMFAAFVMLGKTFSPRIKNIGKQKIYKIDTTRDYGSLTPLLYKKANTIKVDRICEHWDRIGQYFASLETGYTTASTAMKRLAGFGEKNEFYRATRELGRVFKTEHILDWMSNEDKRRRTRQGLLKGEQLHGLARDVNYAKRGRIMKKDLDAQRNTCSCMTLILACIVYWQAKEIDRILTTTNPEEAGIDVGMIKHTSPISWDNVIVYGEYVINRGLIKRGIL